ncbi:glycosyltransferase family 2 protein [Candidatus Microgenomates bacterium]|nr:glycosyltransferase family 2 protein [Candidatus Microgenomates bacterium]
MKFFDRLFKRYPIKTMRALEIMPGLLSWSLILFPFWGSLLVPIAIAYFLIFYNIFWFYKSFYMAATAILAHRKIEESQKINWLEKANKLANFEKVRHLIIIPNYKEKVEKLRDTIQSLVDQNYPKENMVIVLAMEIREAGAQEKVKVLEHEFGKKFGHFYATFHPAIAGEVAGKSSNEAWAGIWAKKKLVDELGYDLDYITVSSVDADSIFHPQYFAYLSFEFLKAGEKRYLHFWQSANVLHNNIWRVPAPIRTSSIISSVWRTSVLLRHDRLIPNSTYSLSLKMLDKVGYWDIDVIPEDYRIFFKAFYKLEGKVETRPIFLTTSMDAAESTTYWKSLLNKYEQEKRWAWGVSDDPLFIKWWLTVPNVSFWDKTVHLIKILEDHILWPVNWFAITIGANIIPFLNPQFSRTVLGYNLPRFSSFILTTCVLALAVILVIDLRQRPKSQQSPIQRKLLTVLEFILMPFTSFFLWALPGIIAHTQLMLGKRLEYKVTEKV